MPDASKTGNAQSMSVTAAAIMGGVSALGSLFNAGSSHYAARKQLQAVRETNEANAALAREQNDWNRQMWEDTNEYNTTVNQMKRWRDAGLSPNSFAAAGSPVDAQSVESAPLANQVPPDYSGYANFGQSVASGVTDTISNMMQAYQMKKIQKETINLDANSELTKQMVKDLTSQMEARGIKMKLDEKQMQTLEKSWAVMSAQILQFEAEANLADTRSNELKLNQNWLKETWNKRKLTVDLQNKLLKEQIGLTNQQAKNAAEMFEGIVIENGLKGNEMLMSKIKNWITYVTALSDTFKTLSDAEKSRIVASFMTNVGGALQMLMNPFEPSKAAEDANKRASWQEALMQGALGLGQSDIMHGIAR